MQDPDHLALDDEWDAEQRTDALLAEEGVDGLNRRRFQVVDHHRLAGECDPPREAAPDGQAKAALHLLLEALRGPGGKRPPSLLDQENRGGVRVEDVRDPVEELLEEIVEIEIGEGRFGDPLDVLQPDDLVRRRGAPLLIGWIWRHRTAKGRRSQCNYSVEIDGSA